MCISGKPVYDKKTFQTIKKEDSFCGGDGRGGLPNDYNPAIVAEKFQGIQSDGLSFTSSA